MQTALEKCSENVTPELNNDLITIYSAIEQNNIPPFMKFFWEEQQKYLKSSNSSSIRYHPMISKFCLNLAANSSLVYNDSKTGSGILVLPSTRTLMDYKNCIKPTHGFNPDVINDLAKKTAEFKPEERFVSILFHEMKIQEDLVWDQYAGELIGFVDLGDI